MQPPIHHTGGLAFGAPQGIPSDAFYRTTGQTPLGGGLLWNNKRRGNVRPAKKANDKDEKEKKGEKAKAKEKMRDVLAAETSGVQKQGKDHKTNVKRRKRVRARKQTGAEKGGMGEYDGEMSGVEST